MLRPSTLQVLSMNAQCHPSDITGPPRGTAIVCGSPNSFSDAHISWQGTADDSGSDSAELAAALWRQAVHDLRGKLGVVMSATAMLHKARSDTRRSELMAVLDRNVAGLRELLNGVADLARLDAKQECPVIRDVDIVMALAQTCSSLQVIASSRGLQLGFTGPASLVAESDPLMLARIAQNLLLNALQYTSAGGVMLTCGPCDAAEAGHWYFDVGDTGSDRVAAPRTSGMPTAAGATSGEGIGLSIVRRLCSLLGGTMDIERASGNRRTTRITLPRRYAGVPGVLTIPALGRGRSAATGAWAPGAVQRDGQDSSPPVGTASPLMHS